MTRYFIIFALAIPLHVIAQNNISLDSGYSKVDKMPEFPGGEMELNKFIYQNLQYPIGADIQKIEGKVVIEFIVNYRGEPLNFKIVKGIGYGCDEEALRVAHSMPRWIPGEINGDPVNTHLFLPVRFKLNIANGTIVDSSMRIAQAPPSFPGGSDSLRNFTARNLQYPSRAKKIGTYGFEELRFIVNEEGEISGLKVMKDIGGDCGDEAVRIVKLMPRWTPAIDNGNVVCSFYTLRIEFSLK